MPASPSQQATTRDRRRKCIAMRLAGAQWEDIATKLRYSGRAAARKDYTRAMQQAAAEAVQDYATALQVELTRLDRLQLAYWKPALDGNQDAAEFVLSLMDRRVKWCGLGAPTRHEVITVGAVEAEIAKLEAELAANDARPVPDRPDQTGAPALPATAADAGRREA